MQPGLRGVLVHGQLCGVCCFLHVLRDDGRCRLLASNTDCYSGTGLLDLLQSCGIYFGPVMSHLNSKICLSVKGSVYRSLYSNSHRNGLQSSHPPDVRVTLKPSWNLQWQPPKPLFWDLPDRAAGVPISSPVLAGCSQLARSSPSLSPFLRISRVGS